MQFNKLMMPYFIMGTELTLLMVVVTPDLDPHITIALSSTILEWQIESFRALTIASDVALLSLTRPRKSSYGLRPLSTVLERKDRRCSNKYIVHKLQHL